jgi:tRNA dimethylallyltransferase
MSSSERVRASVTDPFVLAIFGPTASGKTDVAEAIADRIPARLISADAMQVYRGLPILTNQSERPTELVGIWELDHEASVGEYAELAHAAIDRALAEGETPVVVGGTGLYLRAALVDLDLPPAPEPGARERWENEYDRLGADSAHALLAERDPAAAALVHPNDRRRVVRALELAEAGESLAPREGRLWGKETRHPTVIVGLDVPKEKLDSRIAARTRLMFEAGVEEEVRQALEGPISATARTIHGLTDIAELPRDEALETLVRRTRRYAAYQRKWMRRVPGLVSVAADRPVDEVADEILEVARARQRLPAGPAG